MIRVKDGDDVGFSVRSSRHGPIVNDAIQSVSSTETAAVAMWWSYHDLTNRILEGFYDLAHAGSLSEMRDGVRKMRSRPERPLRGPGRQHCLVDRSSHSGEAAARQRPVLARRFNRSR